MRVSYFAWTRLFPECSIKREGPKSAAEKKRVCGSVINLVVVAGQWPVSAWSVVLAVVRTQSGGGAPCLPCLPPAPLRGRRQQGSKAQAMHGICVEVADQVIKYSYVVFDSCHAPGPRIPFFYHPRRRLGNPYRFLSSYFGTTVPRVGRNRRFLVQATNYWRQWRVPGYGFFVVGIRSGE